MERKKKIPINPDDYYNKKSMLEKTKQSHFARGLTKSVWKNAHRLSANRLTAIRRKHLKRHFKGNTAEELETNLEKSKKKIGDYANLAKEAKMWKPGGKGFNSLQKKYKENKQMKP